ncbi:MAG: hypothetical protein CW336_03590 [Bacteroidetes bacterium]|nr:hypothetical protein [Bacteroidota bacterium]
MEQIIRSISELVWSPALVVICLMAGLYFSIGTRFVQVRRFREMARLLFANDKSRNTGVTSFQAFSESTLSQIYKEENEGQLRGGPSYYIEKGLKCKWLAVLFAVIAVMACGWFLPSVQSNSIAESFAETFHINPAWIGIVVAVLIGLVIVGGVKRGIYSNEAGQGTGAIVAGAAEVSHPVKQGLVQAFSVYVDTLLVCTATAVVIWAIGDTGVGAMAWINVIAILLLSPKAFKALKSYERQKKEGKEPVFNPEEIGVKEAVYWDKYNSEILS